MWEDPIVKEVRAAREKIWKECGYDLRKYCERLKKHEQQRVEKKKNSVKKDLRRKKTP